jgi:hypothetical protein
MRASQSTKGRGATGITVDAAGLPSLSERL